MLLPTHAAACHAMSPVMPSVQPTLPVSCHAMCGGRWLGSATICHKECNGKAWEAGHRHNERKGCPWMSCTKMSVAGNVLRARQRCSCWRNNSSPAWSVEKEGFVRIQQQSQVRDSCRCVIATSARVVTYTQPCPTKVLHVIPY